MSKNIKPIFIIGVPDTFSSEEQSDIVTRVSQRLDEYHVMTYHTRSFEPKFECFNADNFTDINLEELKKFIDENRK